MAATQSDNANATDSNEKKYQFFVLGPGAVGKTALTIRFLSDNFIDEVKSYFTYLLFLRYIYTVYTQ